ncbi:hypothetical protein LSAT2_031105 [Lamellibrachia satsuma]|nr:hypothetical protein LSAT2_031105 [Lamellibrachia satsuma]
MEQEENIAEELIKLHRLYLHPLHRFLCRLVSHWTSLLFRSEPTSSFVESRPFRRKLPCTYEWYEYIERRLLAVVVSFCSIIVITSVWKLSFLRINIVNGTDKIASFVQRLRHLVKTRATEVPVLHQMAAQTAPSTSHRGAQTASPWNFKCRLQNERSWRRECEMNRRWKMVSTLLLATTKVSCIRPHQL